MAAVSALMIGGLRQTLAARLIAQGVATNEMSEVSSTKE